MALWVRPPTFFIPPPPVRSLLFNYVRPQMNRTPPLGIRPGSVAAVGLAPYSSKGVVSSSAQRCFVPPSTCVARSRNLKRNTAETPHPYTQSAAHCSLPRVYLEYHTVQQVVVGGCIGCCTGLLGFVLARAALGHCTPKLAVVMNVLDLVLGSSIPYGTLVLLTLKPVTTLMDS